MNNELIGVISNECELKGVIEDNSFNVIVQITESGPRGDPGPKGNDGYTPIKGVDYFDGEKGVPGEDGSDATVTSSNITDALGYTPANATNEHTHTNKSTIDKFTEVDNKPYYNGEEIGGAVPNLTLNELILGGRYKITYNDVEDSLDIEVI